MSLYFWHGTPGGGVPCQVSCSLEAGHAAMVNVMKEEATLVTLVKPQTEARRSQVRVLHHPVLTFGSYFGFILLEIRKYSRYDNIGKELPSFSGLQH